MTSLHIGSHDITLDHMTWQYGTPQHMTGCHITTYHITNAMTWHDRTPHHMTWQETSQPTTLPHLTSPHVTSPPTMLLHLHFATNHITSQHSITTDAPRKHNQPPPKHHQTERLKVGAHKTPGSAIRLFPIETSPPARPRTSGSITIFWLSAWMGCFWEKNWSRFKHWQQPTDSMLPTESICAFRRFSCLRRIFVFHSTKDLPKCFPRYIPPHKSNGNEICILLSKIGTLKV